MSVYKGSRKPKDYSNTKIYKITNLCNNKIYIGQTVVSLAQRFKQHFLKNSGCKRLKYAIEKYGKENFIIEQIDVANNKQEANEKEIKYIKKYNTINPFFGYNITRGGSNISDTVCAKVYCVELNKIFNSISDCVQELNLRSSSMISAVCTGRKPTYGGYHFCYVGKNDKPIMSSIRYTEPFEAKVKCVETNEIFKNMRLASEWANKTKSAIQACLEGRIKTCGGYHWEYVDEFRKNKKQSFIFNSPRGKNNKKKVAVMCKETKESFCSVSEAAKKYGVYRSSMYAALNNPKRTCKKFHWEYINTKEVA